MCDMYSLCYKLFNLCILFNLLYHLFIYEMKNKINGSNFIILFIFLKAISIHLCHVFLTHTTTNVRFSDEFFCQRPIFHIILNHKK